MNKTAIATIVVTLLLGMLLGSSVNPPADTPWFVVMNAETGEPRTPIEVGHPSFMSPHASPIALSGGHAFVVNTPADTMDVIDVASREVIARVPVGIDPVCVAVRPDGREVWVSNHVSDSVSVIDADPESATYLHVIATIQQFDRKMKATRFDEPVGIAFANNEKAYVALSSENTIAVIDVANRRVAKRLSITAQDPRAIVVHGERLYVIPFESNNQTQLSGGNSGNIDGELVTFDAWDHSVTNNNVLSLGHIIDIVKHPQVPDRDLYVFDTNTDELIETVDTLGTLLYGLTVDSEGRVFIAQTDARNEVNGRAGTKDHGLAELENRAFLNQITVVTEANAEASDGDSTPAASDVESVRPWIDFIDLEPLPPEHPDPADALATPFAIQVSDDDSTLFATAAGSDKLFTVDAETGEVLGSVLVDAAPRGIALQSDKNGEAFQVWVYNAVANTVSLVEVSDPADLTVVETIELEDPTHPAIKRGRIAFNTASASTTGTFACASCHPDGHTDQLLWVLKTPVVTGGDQIMPRSTMPIRGLRDTAPFHWDGIPGDPYGGSNSENVYGHVDPNSDVDEPESTTRHLIDGALASTMTTVGRKDENDEGKAGKLCASQRDDLAKFLLAVPYPPAQRRAYTNALSEGARQGMELFHIEGDDDPTKTRPNVCGDCHRMPYLVSTNTPGTGMDAPTWRGAYDRWLILPQGRLNIIEFDFFARVAEAGLNERNIWQFSWAGRPRFDPVWNMVLEGSTGYSGAFARQVTINEQSSGDRLTAELLDALEQSASDGGVVLQCEGVFVRQQTSTPVVMQYDPKFDGGVYVEIVAGSLREPSAEHPEQAADGTTERACYSRDALLMLAADNRFIGTFTGRHGANADYEHPQPAIWTNGPIEQQRGRQEFPILYSGNRTISVSGRHIRDDAHLIVDGKRVSGTINMAVDETMRIELNTLPATGIHFLQLQNPNGLFSNDFIFHVTEDANSAESLDRRLALAHAGPGSALTDAIASGDLDQVKLLIEDGERVNSRTGDSGMTPLINAAMYDQSEIAEYLIAEGARVSRGNNDGNTPLHIAAFFCREEMAELLLENGGSVSKENERGESAIDVVSSPWNENLAGFYEGIGQAIGLELDLDRMQQDRPRMVTLLEQHADE
ncbi:MAG: ankyrin repeat domain-containing protein [Pirellulaceae bacterium]